MKASTTLGEECHQEWTCGLQETCDNGEQACRCMYEMGVELNDAGTFCVCGPYCAYMVSFSIVLAIMFFVLSVQAAVALRLLIEKRNKTKVVNSQGGSAGVAALVTASSCACFCPLSLILVVGDMIYILGLDHLAWGYLVTPVVGLCMFFMVMAQLSVALVWIDVVAAAKKMQKASFNKRTVIIAGIFYATAWVVFWLMGNDALSNLLTTVYALGIGFIYSVWSKKLAVLVAGSNNKTITASNSGNKPKAAEPPRDTSDSDRILMAGRRMKWTAIIYTVSVIIIVAAGMMDVESSTAMFLNTTFFLLLYITFFIDGFMITSYIAGGRVEGLSPRWKAIALASGLGKTGISIPFSLPVPSSPSWRYKGSSTVAPTTEETNDSVHKKSSAMDGPGSTVSLTRISPTAQESILGEGSQVA